MNNCAHCQDIDSLYDEKKARKELKRYRKKGPIASTKCLIRQLESQNPTGMSLLDVGGGIGAIQHELFDKGLASSLQVDASHGYLQVSGEEAERRGNAEKQRSFFGDFVERADECSEADIVTLDRVICCYPYLDPLLRRSASKARKRLGLVYPKENALTRIGFPVVDLALRIWGKAFQLYLHPRADVHRILEEEGFRLECSERTFLWHVETYVRTN